MLRDMTVQDEVDFLDAAIQFTFSLLPVLAESARR